jgi:hypothetical protein
MNTGLLITGAAIAALVAGGASATVHKSHHKSNRSSDGMYTAPSQPIPYAQLDSYLAAKPGQRASMGDSGVSMPQSSSQSSGDTGMSPQASSNPGAGDQMGSQNGGMSGAGANGSGATPPASGDSGMSGQSTQDSPATTQGAPDGSSPPPK